MRNRGTVVIGLGCQKGGSTWLHDALSQADSARMGPVKEYHVLDRMVLPVEDAGLAADLEQMLFQGLPWNRVRHRLVTYPGAYFDYLSRLAADGHFTADITPAYALMTPDRFRAAVDAFEVRARDVRFIFVMRDPVDRLISHYRMALRHAADQNSVGDIVAWSRLERVTRRGDYEATLRAIEAARLGDRLYAVFFERLFHQNAIDELCRFIGIDALHPQFNRQVHSAEGSLEVAEDVRDELARSFAPLYEALAIRYGQKSIWSVWPSARLVL